MAQKRSFNFQKSFCAETCSRKLEIPSYTESERRDLKRKVLLRNREKKVWEIEISEIGDALFFENGWEKVVKDNCVENGDQLFFIYNSCVAVFDFFVIDTFGCEKIAVGGERARVVEFIRKGSGDESQDVFVLEADIYSTVKKDIKKEEDMDINIDIHTCSNVKKDLNKEKGMDMHMDANARDEENDDDHHKEEDNCNGDDHHTLTHEETRYNNNNNNSSGNKRDANVKKSAIPEHFGADLFRSGRYIQPENAYFVTKIRRTKPSNLYIPKEVIQDYNLELPPIVTLRDMRGREWTAHVHVWGDGRTWLTGGWRSLCRENLVGDEDRCICEFLPHQMGNNVVLQVTIVKEQDAMQMRNE